MAEVPTFHSALALHRAGRLAEAERAYKGVLASDPSNFKAWHHLGIVVLQQNRFDEAVSHIGESLRLNPGQVLAHTNRAAALVSLKRHREALADYNAAVTLQRSPVAYRERARVLSVL